MSEASKKPWAEMKPVFLDTQNVRNANVAMHALALQPGKPRIGAFYGHAGVGKSYWATTYISRQPEASPYLKCQYVWGGSELAFLRALCRAFEIESPPHKKVDCYQLILDGLTARRHLPLFVDDFHRMPRGHLEIMRDLTELSGAPVVLIGEEPLEAMLQAHDQVWSRTYQAMKFRPNEVSDVVLLARNAAGLELAREAATHLHQWASGDFRPLDSALAGLLQYAQAQGKGVTISLEDVKVVLKTMLQPRTRRSVK
ncbi:MAG: ATP-binding protein [Candidatus Cloacimonadaceae bacterium]|jgi:DNA transposition AAA+ family ATPase